jgi:hypothetical protein
LSVKDRVGNFEWTFRPFELVHLVEPGRLGAQNSHGHARAARSVADAELMVGVRGLADRHRNSRSSPSIWSKGGKLYVRPTGEKPIATGLDDTPSNRAQVRRELDTANRKREAERKLTTKLGTGVPTLREWFSGGADVKAKETPRGRYWSEWVVAQKNGASEIANKVGAYIHHLEPELGHLSLDKITTSEVNRFKAYLVSEASGLASDRSRNNILTHLSTMLKAAVEAQVIVEMPTIRPYKYKRPQIEWWKLAEYPRLLEAAKAEGPIWCAAVALAGEAGLRQGEIRGLRWREDVDLVGRVLTVNQQGSSSAARTARRPPFARCSGRSIGSASARVCR